MDILRQCQIWHEKGEYQKYLTCSGVPAPFRTLQINSEMARACVRLVAPRTPEGRDLFKKSVNLLKSHE